MSLIHAHGFELKKQKQQQQQHQQQQSLAEVTAQGFFLYFALHNTHSPIEAPARFVALYNFSLAKRNVFNAMVSVVDEAVENVTQALKEVVKT